MQIVREYLTEKDWNAAMKEGEKQKAITTAQNFLKLQKVSIEDIAVCTGLTIDEVSKLESEMHTAS